jgi:hypothetical protein
MLDFNSTTEYSGKDKKKLTVLTLVEILKQLTSVILENTYFISLFYQSHRNKTILQQVYFLSEIRNKLKTNIYKMKEGSMNHHAPFIFFKDSVYNTGKLLFANKLSSVLNFITINFHDVHTFWQVNL